jgi:DnaJ family protein C protein 28
MWNGSRRYQSASEKLFADAEKEEKDEELARLKERVEQRLKQEDNWTGDERIEDTVLRMLVDKHKPLRSSSMQTADQKLKANPPQVLSWPMIDSSARSHNSDVLLPGIEGHKPWMTTYKTPSFAVQPSIRSMRLPPQQITKRSQLDESMPVKGPTREERARVADANRLMSAKERMIDYRFGGPGANVSATTEAPRTNPKTMKGWKSLVEERIEVCQYHL